MERAIFKMTHPKHGECWANSEIEEDRRILGWRREGETEDAGNGSSSTESVEPTPAVPEGESTESVTAGAEVPAVEAAPAPITAPRKRGL